MSSGQKPRNPYYFPRMKVRGARRRELAYWQRLGGSFNRVATSASVAAAQVGQLYVAMVNAQDALNQMFTTQELLDRCYRLDYISTDGFNLGDGQ